APSPPCSPAHGCRDSRAGGQRLRRCVNRRRSVTSWVAIFGGLQSCDNPLLCLRPIVIGRGLFRVAAAVALEQVDITFRLAGGGEYHAVRDATLSVADGEFVSIVGPTGCGKSTLLNVAAGLLGPASGTAKIYGEQLGGLNRQAGYLFQADALFPWKTAIENVA